MRRAAISEASQVDRMQHNLEMIDDNLSPPLQASLHLSHSHASLKPGPPPPESAETPFNKNIISLHDCGILKLTVSTK